MVFSGEGELRTPLRSYIGRYESRRCVCSASSRPFRRMSSKRKPPIVYRSSLARTIQNSCKDKSIAPSISPEPVPGFQSFKDHIGMGRRLKKTLYYGRHPKTERPSLPMSELAVEIFTKSVPDGLGRIDMHYASSVSRSACISPCSMILAMAYLERLKHRSPEYLQQQVSSSDLFLVSMMVASKFLYDEGEDEEVFNDEWAVSASMDVKDLNQLERNFLKAIDWNVCVSRTTFEQLLRKTEYAVAVRKCRERGWSTYTELAILCEDGRFAACWKPIVDYAVKVIAVSALAYTASVLTMIGATLIANQVRTHLAPQPCCVSSCSPPKTAMPDRLLLDGNDSCTSGDERFVCCSSSSSSFAVPMLEVQLDSNVSSGPPLTTSDDGLPFWLLTANSDLWQNSVKDVLSFRATATSLSDRNYIPNSTYSWPRRWPSCCRQTEERVGIWTAMSNSFSTFVVAIS